MDSTAMLGPLGLDIDAVAVFGAALLTAASLRDLGRRIVGGKSKEEELYRDKDGVATEESTRKARGLGESMCKMAVVSAVLGLAAGMEMVVGAEGWGKGNIAAVMIWVCDSIYRAITVS